MANIPGDGNRNIGRSGQSGTREREYSSDWSGQAARDERRTSTRGDWPSDPTRGSTFESGSRRVGGSHIGSSYTDELDQGRFQTGPSERGSMGDRDTAGLYSRSRNRGPKNWQRSDERIQDDICERLSRAHDVDVSDISVAVQQGTVTLSGTVPDRSLKHRIEDIADDCAGVRDVENRLRVRTERSRESAGGFWSELFGFEAGARARDVMTREVLVVGPQDMIQRAAQIMKDADIGAVPVCDGRRLQGMITDRDIAVRAVAMSRPADRTPVTEAMTSEVFWCYEDEDIADVLDKMGDRQVRRIPVVDREKSLVGIISLGDMATQRGGTQVQGALEDISEPSQVRH